jgi:hypothetical protein
MDRDEPIIRITDESSASFPEWFNDFLSTPSESQLLNPKSTQEILFQSLIFSLANSVKNSLKPLISGKTTENEFNSILESSKILLPEIIFNQDPSLQTSPESESKESIFDLAPDAKDEDEKVECDVFQRALRILNLNGRSENELFAALDINHDGKVNVFEFWAEFKRNDADFFFEEVSEVFKILDGDKDGWLFLNDIKKRIKFIEQKAFDEISDPLSCLIVPEPLKDDLIHGVLKVQIGKITGLKGGPRCLRFKLRQVLEYLSHDFTDNQLPFGYKCEFPFENQSLTQINSNFEIELLNKNVVEGSGSFNWFKNHELISEFSFKHKTDLKTSLGQSKGTVNCIVHWIPSKPKQYSQEELTKKRLLKEKALKYQQELESKTKGPKKNFHRFTDECIDFSEKDDDYLLQASSEAKGYKKDQSFIVQISQTSFEQPRSPRNLYHKSTITSFDSRSPCKMEFLKTKTRLDNSFQMENRPKTPTTPTSKSNLFEKSPFNKRKDKTSRMNKSFAL